MRDAVAFAHGFLKSQNHPWFQKSNNFLYLFLNPHTTTTQFPTLFSLLSPLLSPFPYSLTVSLFSPLPGHHHHRRCATATIDDVCALSFSFLFIFFPLNPLLLCTFFFTHCSVHSLVLFFSFLFLCSIQDRPNQLTDHVDGWLASAQKCF